MTALAMPLFVNPEDVILRMQLPGDLSGVQEIVSSGIIGAQLHVQRILDGELSRKSQSCVFQLERDFFSGIQPGSVFRLEIPSGFIRQDTPVVVTATAPGSVSQPASVFGEYAAVDPTLMKIDYDRGYILLDATKYGNTYVKVLCDTGWEDGTRPVPVTGIDPFDANLSYTVGQQVVYNNAVWKCTVDTVIESPVVPTPVPASDLTHWALAYVAMEQIPTPLYEAIMALVPMVFNASQATNRNNEAESQYKTMADHAGVLLQPFVRTRGFSLRPIWK